MSIQTYGFLNGEIKLVDEIYVSPFDRAYLFGDAVYEVVPIFNGHYFHLKKHLNRLSSSLKASEIHLEHSIEALEQNLVALISANSFSATGSLYLQISRGVSKPRLHDFSTPSSPTIFAYLSQFEPASFSTVQAGGKAILRPDLRWGRCDIKSTNLLANCMAKEEARLNGATETILHRDGYITEASVSTVFTVINQTLITTPLSPAILPGITREITLEIANQLGITALEEKLEIDAFLNANEVFISSSTKDLFPILSIEGRPVGDGKPGPIWEKLYHAYQGEKQAR